MLSGMAAPNDLCFGPDGRFYFTDPRAPADPADRDSALPGRLYACARDGTGIELLHEGPRFINGLAFSARGEALFLAETAFPRSEEHTSELQSLMRNSYAVFCLKKKKKKRA